MEYPQGTTDLYNQLGAHKHGEGASHEHSLGVSTEPKETIEHVSPEHSDQTHAPKTIDNMDQVITRDSKSKTFVVRLSKFKPGKVLKQSWPYVLIFFVALFFYLVLFTNFSVISFVKNAPKDVGTKVVQADKPDYQNLDIYYQWINSYFYEVKDPKITDPGNDISGNGLTNYQKFLLGLNPKKQDTMGLGKTDTEALIEGINPLTGSPLTSDQKNLIAQYVDLEAVANKLALQTANSAPKVAGTSTDELNRNNIEINTDIPGTIEIPKLNITVPVIWTKDTKDFEADLAKGVTHYPGTAMPGELGTAYISGHSSNYSWAKGSYNKIFDKLDELKQYDSFNLIATDTNGKKVTFHYVVSNKQIFKADDQAQFISQNKSIVALSTCWPIGTSSKRLVVFGELSQTDR